MDSQVVFFGSSYFSVLVLQRLLDAQVSIAAVVTFPDKPVGRHLQLTPNPVKDLAKKHNLKTVESGTELMAFLMQSYRITVMTPPVALVAAYGRIIKPEILSIFNNQIYNIHPSLLPKYRGPSPLQQQILDGTTETGVTIIQLDNEMDHGPIVAQKTDVVLPTDTTYTMGERLFIKGTDLFVNFLLDPKRYTLTPQIHNEATYTQKLSRQSGFIEFTDFQKYSTFEDIKFRIGNMWRALYPWPGVWSVLPNGKKVKLVSLDPPLAQIESESKPVPIAQLLS